MNVQIAHPQRKGRKRSPVIHSDAASGPGGPTPLQILIAEANTKAGAKKRGQRKPSASSLIGMDLEQVEKLDPKTTEGELSRSIIAYARRYGWSADCKRPSIEAVRTPTGVARDDWEAIGNGIPDWILLHEERALLVFWELKRDHKPSPLRLKQVKWGSGLGAIASMYPNIVYRVISPADWPYIKAVLRGH